MSRSFRCLLLVAVAATTAACSSSTGPSAPLAPRQNVTATGDQPTPSNAGRAPQCAETESCVTP